MPTDIELLEAWRTGDRESGEVLFDRYFPRVRRFLLGKVESHLDDLVQRTFLKCAESRERIHTDFRTYLFAVARNELWMHYRSRGSPNRAWDPEVTAVEDVAPAAPELLADREEQRLLLRALRRLPLSLQVALELHYWERFTTEQLATILEIPQGTVKSRLRRGRDRLRTVMGDLAESPQLLHSTLDNLDRWVESMRGHVESARDHEN